MSKLPTWLRRQNAENNPETAEALSEEQGSGAHLITAALTGPPTFPSLLI